MAQAKAKPSGAVEKKLIGVDDTVITAAERSKDPTLAIPVRSLANVNFNAQRGIMEDPAAQYKGEDLNAPPKGGGGH